MSGADPGDADPGDADPAGTRPVRTPSASRTWLLLPAGVAMLAGLDAALVRAGLAAPVSSDRLGQLHGVLMVLGFLGTLIALERAVSLRARWGYAAPVLLGVGGLAVIAPPFPVLAALLIAQGCAVLVAVLAALWRRQRDHATAAQVLAAVMATCAAILVIRVDVAAVTPWLVGFIVITIAAERVELARWSLPASAGVTLLIAAVALLGSAIAALLWPEPGYRLLGAALLALVGWLARIDVARRTIRLAGLPRFSAAAMLLGYAWLAVAALTWLAVGRPDGQAGHDTTIHAVFLGFAMSMVIAHAPVILPSVTRRALPYRPVLILPLVVLHVGLVLRIGLGNAAGLVEPWRVGIVLTVASLPLFAVVVLALVLRPGKRRPVAEPARDVLGSRA